MKAQLSAVKQVATELQVLELIAKPLIGLLLGQPPAQPQHQTQQQQNDKPDSFAARVHGCRLPRRKEGLKFATVSRSVNFTYHG
jgi:hypothetical protein